VRPGIPRLEHPVRLLSPPVIAVIFLVKAEPVVVRVPVFIIVFRVQVVRIVLLPTLALLPLEVFDLDLQISGSFLVRAEVLVDEPGPKLLVEATLAVFSQGALPMWGTWTAQLKEARVPGLHFGLLVEVVPNASILDSLRNASRQDKRPVVATSQ
jgi:hypothetical protein